MTDRDVNERLLRLNAALDGELDAMGSLEFEREMRDDPAIAAEYRRLTALRDAVRRHAPARSGPASACRSHRGADRVRSGGSPASGGHSPDRDGRSVSAAHVARQPRAGDGRLLRCARLRGRRRAYVAAHARGLRRCRPTSGFGFRARRNRRPTLRRRLLRPAHGQALACQPHDHQRNHRRSRAGRLPAGGRARDHCRPGPNADARLSAQ